MVRFNFKGVCALAISAMLVAPATAEIAEGLVSYWPLNGDFVDVVGQNDGELIGEDEAFFDDGQFDQGIVLDGIDQFIEIGGDESEFDFIDQDFSIDPDRLFFHSAEMQLAAFAVGTADILAQMADRYYLERLPFLFLEFQEAGLDVHNSPQELMQQTSKFYHDVVIDRLAHSFGNVTRYLKIHFRERWAMEENLYLVNMKKNIKYMQYIIAQTDADMFSLRKYLRRNPPA